MPASREPTAVTDADRERAQHLEGVARLPEDWRYEGRDLDKAIAVMCSLGVMGACSKEVRGQDKCGWRCYRVRALARGFYQMRADERARFAEEIAKEASRRANGMVVPGLAQVTGPTITALIDFANWVSRLAAGESTAGKGGGGGCEGDPALVTFWEVVLAVALGIVGGATALVVAVVVVVMLAAAVVGYQRARLMWRRGRYGRN